MLHILPSVAFPGQCARPTVRRSRAAFICPGMSRHEPCFASRRKRNEPMRSTRNATADLLIGSLSVVTCARIRDMLELPERQGVAILSKRIFFVLALLLLGLQLACHPGSGGGGGHDGPVILITVDTLRADRIGAYGSAQALETTSIDRIAREGAMALRAVVPVGRTTQSVGTILTGLHPLNHGADGLGMNLDDSLVTMAEILGKAGYQTAAFTSNTMLQPGKGFEQGFGIYSNPRNRWRGNHAEEITEEAISWLDHRAADGNRFFLWLHYLDPHWSYEPEEKWAQMTDPEWSGPFDLFARHERGEINKGEIIFFAEDHLSEREITHMRKLYDGEVLQTDAAIGHFLDALESRNLLDESLIVLTSDHGEALGAHEYWFAHGETLYDDTLQVPWVVRFPSVIPAGTVLDGVLRVEETLPTILGLLNLDGTTGIDGEDISDRLREGGRSTLPIRPAIHLTDINLLHEQNPRRWGGRHEGRWWSARLGRWKLIQIPTGPGEFQEELYDLDADPEEASNLAEIHPEKVDELRLLIEAEREAEQTDFRDDDEIDLEHLEELHSLGYATSNNSRPADAQRETHRP